MLKKIYFVGVSKGDAKKGVEKLRLPLGYVQLPAGALGQPDAVGMLTITASFCNYPAMPDDVVYEVLRIGYENIAAFKTFHALGAGMTHQTMGWLPVKSVDEVHPAAVKFYKERGV